MLLLVDKPPIGIGGCLAVLGDNLLRLSGELRYYTRERILPIETRMVIGALLFK